MVAKKPGISIWRVSTGDISEEFRGRKGATGVGCHAPLHAEASRDRLCQEPENHHGNCHASHDNKRHLQPNSAHFLVPGSDCIADKRGQNAAWLKQRRRQDRTPHSECTGVLPMVKTPVLDIHKSAIAEAARTSVPTCPRSAVSVTLIRNQLILKIIIPPVSTISSQTKADADACSIA
eukprot:1982676-Rhodomonas_salina.1